MTIETVVARFGYPAVFAGSFLEGETVAIIAGFLASRDYLEFWPTALLAASGTFLADQWWFWLGRRGGRAVLDRRPMWRRHAATVLGWIDRNQDLAAFGCRFLYGFRTVLPMALGTTGMRGLRFALINGASGLIWTLAFISIGYWFGETAERLVEDIERHEMWIVAVIALIGASCWAVWSLRSRRHRARP